MDRYKKEIAPKLLENLKIDNIHNVPKFVKVVISMGAGIAVQDRKKLDELLVHIEQISGQKPLITKAKKAISSFRLRKGMDIGCKVTLRGARMYEFLDRLISLALPRVRDFRGMPRNGFDGNGNYNMGLTEQLVFPEIDGDKVNTTHGMNISIVTNTSNDEKSFELLKSFGFPFGA